MTAHLDVNEIRRALSAMLVLDYYAWTSKPSGSQRESTACPIRADHSRRALVISAATGLWKCHACDESGDLFDFIALREGLEIASDFPAVLAKAAEIGGVTPTEMNPDERRRAHEEWRRKRNDDERVERERKAQRDADAIPTASRYWSELDREHRRGIGYLDDRGVADVMRFDDVVRFDARHAGSPSVALHTSDGRIRNVVARRLPELGEPKTPGLGGCPTPGTLINSVADIAALGGRDVVLTEGVVDSITATLAWPSALVLGAHGAANLPKIARMAAPAVASASGRMFLVPHRDERGYESGLEAARIALQHGLSLRSGTLVIVDIGSKDLNDAWRCGWRASA